MARKMNCLFRVLASAILALTIGIPLCSAQGFDCPKATKQVDYNITADLDGHARSIIKLGTLEFKGG